MRMAHCAAHDAEQNVAAAVVGGHDAVSNQEGCRAQVIGDDAVVHVLIAIWINGCGMCRGFNERFHQIGVVVVVAALQQRADAL